MTYANQLAWTIKLGGRLPTHAEVTRWIAARLEKTTYTESEWSAGALNDDYASQPLNGAKGNVWVPVSDSHKYTFVGTGD